jgi:hypothetical protein
MGNRKTRRARAEEEEGATRSATEVANAERVTTERKGVITLKA